MIKTNIQPLAPTLPDSALLPRLPVPPPLPHSDIQKMVLVYGPSLGPRIRGPKIDHFHILFPPTPSLQTGESDVVAVRGHRRDVFSCRVCFSMKFALADISSSDGTRGLKAAWGMSQFTQYKHSKLMPAEGDAAEHPSPQPRPHPPSSTSPGGRTVRRVARRVRVRARGRIDSTRVCYSVAYYTIIYNIILYCNISHYYHY